MAAALESSSCLVLVAITRNLLWLLLPDNMGMSIAAFFLTSGLIFALVINCVDTWEPQPYVPKRRHPSKGLWIKYFLKALNRCLPTLMKLIKNMKVSRKYRLPGHRYYGHHYRCKKIQHGLHAAMTGMTTTWANEWTKTPSLGKQFNSDLQALMLDDGASACITNNKNDFIEPPKCVDCKVKGIKGHTKATH